MNQLPPENSYEDPIKSIAGRMRLKEGEEAVRRVITSIFRAGKIGTKDIARDARLPIPVTAAIRRELEKEGLVARKGGAVLTPEGKKYATSTMGLTDLKVTSTGDEKESELLEFLRKVMEGRPPASPELDQAHATPETTLRRVQYMRERGDLDGRRVLFLGDDDLTSIASSLLGAPKEIVVLDIDDRLIEYLNKVSSENSLKVECIIHDLRMPLPEKLQDRFDVFFMDPPYTVDGLSLFLSRGLQALRPRKTATGYFAYADKTPLEMLEVHKAVNDMGLYISELIPKFNTYIGAEIFANTTSMYRLTVTENAEPAITGTYNGKIYTGEAQPRIRYYRCRCSEEIKVGPKETFTSINQLKESGCPRCGAKDGFQLRRRENI